MLFRSNTASATRRCRHRIIPWEHRRISRERIGYGDGIIFLVLGACVEPSVVLWVLWISMLAAGIMGGILIIAGKRGREKPIPYIPFVASAYMLTCVLQMTAG